MLPDFDISCGNTLKRMFQQPTYDGSILDLLVRCSLES